MRDWAKKINERAPEEHTEVEKNAHLCYGRHNKQKTVNSATEERLEAGEGSSVLEEGPTTNMDVNAFQEVSCMPIVKVADAVRACQAGDEVRVLTDVEALISDMRAFARMSGNVVERVETNITVTVDLHEGTDHVFVPDLSRSGGETCCWVIVLRVLSTNRLTSHNG